MQLGLLVSAAKLRTRVPYKHRELQQTGEAPRTLLLQWQDMMQLLFTV